MCLIVVAHEVASKIPLVIAANRDEDYDRPSRAAHLWDDNPDILGGRDALHGGSWLAIRRDGRWAAVTNLRGTTRTPDRRSRGHLVRDFLSTTQDAAAYARDVATRNDQYAAFHLLLGGAGESLVQLSENVMEYPPGIVGLSNSPVSERWPKVDAACDAMAAALKQSHPEPIAESLLRFLGTPPVAYQPEREPFVAGEKYGTRSSTVIVATAEQILFIEQNYARGGSPDGLRRVFRLDR